MEMQSSEALFEHENNLEPENLFESEILKNNSRTYENTKNESSVDDDDYYTGGDDNKNNNHEEEEDNPSVESSSE